jgi:ElaB/YqjD/DUF883 family membrane-anchored ribosome-binding protein
MNSAQLESQSELRRNSVEDTLGELRARLTPGEILDETLAYAKDGGGQFLSNLGRQIADNPLPVTLVGAGLALYLFSNGKGTGSAPAASTREGANGGTFTNTAGDIANAARDMGSSVVDKASDYSSRIGEGVSDGYKAAGSGLSSAAQSIGSAASSATDAVTNAAQKTAELAGSVKQTAAETSRSTVAFLKDQPLIMVGVGIALGAAIGGALPATDLEDELMGEASDELKAQAKNMASEQLDEVGKSGARLADEMTEKAKSEANRLADNLNEKIGSSSQNVSADGQVSGNSSDLRGNGYSSSQ